MEYQSFNAFIAPLSAFWTQIATFVPKLLAAMVLLFVGLAVAKLVRKVILHVLNYPPVDKIAAASGIEKFLAQGEINIKLSVLISQLVYWLMMFVVIVIVSDNLGLQVVAELFNRIVLYIPNILVAILVLVIGSVLSSFIQRIVHAYLNNFGVEGSRAIAAISGYAVLIFVIFIALEQLHIGAHFLMVAFQLGFGAICLAAGIAFGLGGKDSAAKILDKISSKICKK